MILFNDNASYYNKIKIDNICICTIAEPNWQRACCRNIFILPKLQNGS